MGKWTAEIKSHPFGDHIHPDATTLIVGTFPVYSPIYNFYYSSDKNRFWDVISSVFRHTFKFNDGERAVIERKKFLDEKRIGITDMHEKCYRINYSSFDENLYPIILKDIFYVLDRYTQISRLIFTSRTRAVGALGLFITYLMRQGVEVPNFQYTRRGIIQDSIMYKERQIDIFVPYSTSYRVMKDDKITFDELVRMYQACLIV